MTYLETLVRDRQIRQNIESWQEKRTQLMYLANHYYQVKGDEFARELEALLKKYQDAPEINGKEILNNLTRI
jgi:hypothetical protein